MTFNLEQFSDTVKVLDMNLRNAFFPGGVFCNLNDSLQSQEKLGSVHTCLRLMRDLHATLGSVFTTVREKAPRVERHHNLMTLPDEILSYIINLVCEDARERSIWVSGRNGVERVVKTKLSLVSRRFRNVIVNTASLWAHIDNRYCLAAGFDEWIERSKGLPLTLFIDFGVESDGERQNILSRIMPIKDRCQCLRARVDAKDAKEVPVAEFSAAESLELFFSGCSRSDWSRVFKKWTFPNVTSLRINEALPPPGIFPNVTTCTLFYDPGSLGVDNFSYERLLQMLTSMPQLRHLTVKFGGDDIPLPIDLVPVTLASVSTITLGDKLGIHKSRVSPRLGRILASLTLPNVKDIHLRIIFTMSDAPLLAWAHSITPVSETLREVTSLTVEDSFGRSGLTRNTMYTLFALFRNIRRLELMTYRILRTLRDLEENLELNQLRTFIPRNQYAKPVKIEKGDLDKLTRYPDDVRVA